LNVSAASCRRGLLFVDVNGKSKGSKALPFLRPKHLQPYLALPDDEDETTRLRKYVNWLRVNLPAK
jgi:hypothetical protein